MHNISHEKRIANFIKIIAIKYKIRYKIIAIDIN